MIHLNLNDKSDRPHQIVNEKKISIESLLWSIVDNSSDGIFIIDVHQVDCSVNSQISTNPKTTDFRLNAANATARKILSIKQNQLDICLKECLAPAMLENIWKNLLRCQQQKQLIAYEICRSQDHRCQNIKITLFPVETVDGKIEKIVGLCQDITNKNFQGITHKLLPNITQAIADAPDLNSALNTALAKIGKATNWNYGEAWLLDENNNILKCSATWHSKLEQEISEKYWDANKKNAWTKRLEKFRKFPEKLTFAPGVGLPGKIWISKKIEWLTDISQASEAICLRDNYIKKIGFKSAVGIPIIAGDRLLAILIFFSYNYSLQNQTELILAIAQQLGALLRHKQIEIELEENQRRMKNFIDALPGAVFSCMNNRDQSLSYLSEGILNITGYSKEEIQNNQNFSYNAITNTEDLPKVLKIINNAMKLQENYMVEYRISTKSGQEKWLWEKGIGVFNELGELLFIEGFISDINDFKQAEEAIRIQALVLENMAEGVSMSDENDIILLTNPAFDAMFGYDRGELKGKNLSELTATNSSEYNLIKTQIIDDLKQKGFWTGEFTNRKKNGSLFPTYAHISSLEIAGKKYWVSVQSDISDRKQTENALRQAEEKYRSIFENAIEGIFQTTPEGHYITANPMLARIYGYESPEELTANIRDIEHQLYVDPRRRDEFKHILQKQGNVRNFESEVYRKDGSIIWISENARAIKDDQGKIIGYEGKVEDITQRKQAEKEILQRDNLLQGVAEAMNYLLTDKNHSEAVIKALATLGKAAGVDRVYICENHSHESTGEIAFSKRFEWTRDGITSTINQPEWQNQPYNKVGMGLVFDRLISGNSVNGLIKDFPLLAQKLLNTNNIHSILIVPILVNNQFWGYIGFDDCNSDRQWSTSEEMILIAIAASIGGSLQRHRTEEIMRHQAFHDRLTDLPNRLLFDYRLPLALETAKNQNHKLAVCFLDLDRFKIINDTLGHAIGDKLLQTASERLSKCLRENDTIARWGGDEFILLLPQINSKQDAAKVATRLLEVLQPAFAIEGHQLYITCSIGIAVYPHDGKNPETLLKNADVALYRAKEQGRNNYQLYSPKMNSKASELLILENSLHTALEKQEFLIYYQPQINSKNGDITRMEALIRWQHPTLGLIPPKQFIPLAEDTGLILPIGEWVLKTACTQNKAWQNAGLPKIRVAVNLSARQFQQPNLVKTVRQILQETQLDPIYLELEITETTAMLDVNFTSNILNELRGMGVYLSMDDFGTGYASLSYLKQLPFHTIKIDRTFIKEITNNHHDAAIVKAIIDLAKNLNLSVVAEGVETQAQRDILENLHCQEMQGFFFSKPLETFDATNFLSRIILDFVI